MLKAYKYRIYPNEEQKTIFAKTFGCVRLVWNLMLNEKLERYQRISELKNSQSLLKFDKVFKFKTHKYFNSPIVQFRVIIICMNTNKFDTNKQC